MPLESASYINQLVASNPDGAVDTKNTLDDHIRLIKFSLRQTLPNYGGAVNATHTETNYLVGVTSAIQTQLNTLTSAAAAKMPLAGGTFTGPPIWATAPSAASHLVNKQYADGAYSAAATAQSTANNAQTTANNATTAAGTAQAGVNQINSATLPLYQRLLQSSNGSLPGYIFTFNQQSNVFLPSGGTWFYLVVSFASDGTASDLGGGANIAAGGTQIFSFNGTTRTTAYGFAIRLT